MKESDGSPRVGSGFDVGALLDAVEAAAPVDAAAVVGAALGDVFDAKDVSLLLADYSGDALIRLGSARSREVTRRSGEDTATAVPLTATPAGQALAEQEVRVVAEGSETRVFAPVTSRGEAVGVLELLLRASPDEFQVTQIARAAHVLAYIVVANRRFTDLFEWGQRSVPLSLAAEIQHRLLPGSYTCEAGQFTLAGWLEPAGDVAGDTFDFSLEREALWFSMTDAMGHNVNASMLATLLVGSLRNGRRRGLGLAEQARVADAAVIEHAGDLQFVTGQIVRVDLLSGHAEIVNAGHPLPLRLREGRVEEIPLKADPPLGLCAGEFRVQTLPLRPGDRLMFVTDGVLERKSGAFDPRPVLAASRDAHPREAVHELVRATLRESEWPLPDDATVLCFDWHGGPRRARTTNAGADVHG